MAIINCPSCKQQISDKAKQCPHCKSSPNDSHVTAGTDSPKVARIKAMQSIQTQTMLALVMSIAGFVFYYWDGFEDKQLQTWIGMGVILLGMVWYLVSRVRIAILNNKFKK